MDNIYIYIYKYIYIYIIYCIHYIYMYIHVNMLYIYICSTLRRSKILEIARANKMRAPMRADTASVLI
jgi:hypothetical protein